jgi:hypothetical protein
VRVLIIGKTRMQHAWCVGGLELSHNRSLRLLQVNGHHQPIDTQFDVGDIWELDYRDAVHLEPPHLEGVLVDKRGYVKSVKALREGLLRHVTPWRGNPSALFNGLLRCTNNGRGFISERTGVPDCSTGFWLPDRSLRLLNDNGKRVYGYAEPNREFGIRTLTYVGAGDPDADIPAGGLVRVSLASWWKPDEAAPDFERRCYLQLSGWFPT